MSDIALLKNVPLSEIMSKNIVTVSIHEPFGNVYDKSELNLLSLEHFMTHDPVTLTAERKLSDAIDIFVRDKFGCIPIVTADKKIAGVISHSDILKYFLKAFA